MPRHAYTVAVMHRHLHPHSPVRIFAFSTILTIATLVAVLLGMGPAALLLTVILVVVELTFSFDNAIVNAKILEKLSKPWQTLFLTVGVLVAIFGMRVVFPVVIVMITAGLGWGDVMGLALHDPEAYAHHLEQAHASIVAFGGTFLLMLGLTFFFDDERDVHWIAWVEERLKRLSHWSAAPVVAVLFIAGLAVLPVNNHAHETVVAGLIGIGTYVLLQLLDVLFMRLQGGGAAKVKPGGLTGLAAFSSFIYLQVLDASFSFDGVLGAFAITTNVILIAAGLGIGALWVRSMTVYIVRRGTLGKYLYLEHGAHYTVLLLALIMLASIIWEISEYVPGLVGIGVIGASVIASIQAARHRRHQNA